MPRGRKRVEEPMEESMVEEPMVEAKMPRITHDYGRVDLNEMRDRVNELMEKHCNC